MKRLIAPFGVTNTGTRFLIKDFKGTVVCECDQSDHAYGLCKLLNLFKENNHDETPEGQTSKLLDIG